MMDMPKVLHCTDFRSGTCVVVRKRVKPQRAKPQGSMFEINCVIAFSGNFYAHLDGKCFAQTFKYVNVGCDLTIAMLVSPY